MELFPLLAGVVGGVGLFLLGMHLMTEGLRLAAGRSLRTLLSRWTGTPLRGLFSGALLTAIVQSSSAVTVAAIGFVNAGLLSLAQSVAVVYGSNVGTTATGWLVALVGIHVNLKALALPMIGAGMLMRIVGRGRRVAPLGEALAGFGVFFLGIDVLKDVFEGLGDPIQLEALAGSGAGRMLFYVGAGFLLTLLLQSSSAAIALILTAAAGDVIPLGIGAALVIGANVGTTSTAALAVLGATSNAKRVAAAHIAFNGITGAVALALLPALLVLIQWGRVALQLGTQPAAVLAAFHTLFNVLGVALLLPFTGRLVRFLEKRFVTADEAEAKPRYLDRNVATTPVLALNALVMELTRLGGIARRATRSALAGSATPGRIAEQRSSVECLVEAVGSFAVDVERKTLPKLLGDSIPTALRIARYYSELAELAEEIAAKHEETGPLTSAAVWPEVSSFVHSTDALIESAGLEQEGYSRAKVAARLQALEASYQALKAALLRSGGKGELAVRPLVSTLDWLSNARRAAEQAERGARFLAGLADAVRDGESRAVAGSDGQGADAP